MQPRQRRRLRQRLIQTLVLAVVVAGGVWAYLTVVRPDPGRLERLAREKLVEIFGPNVSYDDVRIDLLESVVIEDLKVQPSATTKPTLVADEVRIVHDIVALASGSYQPEAIVIRGARVVTSETETGIQLDFPFTLASTDAEGPVPRVRVEGARFLFRAMEDSTRLAAGRILELELLELDIVPQPEGVVRITGALNTVGLGYEALRGDEPDITLRGTAEPNADVLVVTAQWSPETLTDELMATLAPEVGEPLRRTGMRPSDLYIRFERNPDVEQGAVQLNVEYVGEVEVDIGAFPGARRVDDFSRQQLASLFRRADLSAAISKTGIKIEELVTGLGGGQLVASGTIQEEGDRIDLHVRLRNVRIESPSFRKALQEEVLEVIDAFEPRGLVNADILITKTPGGELDWELDAMLEDLSLKFHGFPEEDGSAAGFPYEMSQASGHVHFEDGVLTFDPIVGFNGMATVRIRGHEETSWTGGETGRIRITDAGPDFALTVDARNVKVDDKLREAVEGSEFAGLLDEFRLQGLINQIEVDIVSDAQRDDKAVAEVRIQLQGERFRYAAFLLDLQDVTGWVTLTRPFLAEGGRGQVIAFNVEGEADGAPVRAHAVVQGHKNQGTLRVTAEGIPLSGSLAKAILESPVTMGGVEEVWKYLDPRGRADVTVDLPIDEHPDPTHLVARLREATIKLDADDAPEPIEIRELSGTLEVNDDVVTLRDLAGRIGESKVFVEGRMEGGLDGRWDLEVTTEVLRLTPELLSSLPHYTGGGDLLPSGLQLESGGHVSLVIELTREPGEDEPLVAEVVARDVDTVIRLPAGTPIAVRGRRLEVRRGVVELEDVQGEALGLRVDVKNVRVDESGLAGRFLLALEEFEGTSDLLLLAPEGARRTIGRWLEDRRLSTRGLTIDAQEDGSVRLEGHLAVHAARDAPPGGAPRGELELRPLVIAPSEQEGEQVLEGRAVFHGISLGKEIPVTDLEGEVDIRRFRLGSDPAGTLTLRARHARVLDIRVHDLVVPVVWRDGILRVEQLQGEVAGGRLEGSVLVHTREPAAYEGEARITNLDVARLREDLAPDAPPYRGVGQIEVTFQNRTGAARDLTAAGRVRIDEGHLGDLPSVATIFALADSVLGAENPPHFERARADFTLQDEVVRFRRLDLSGPLFELPGRGTIDLDGTADLTFKPHLIKGFVLPGINQLPGVGQVLGKVLREDLLYVIRIRGDLTTAEPEVEPLPPAGLFRTNPFEGAGAPALPPRRIPRWFR